MSTYHTGKTRYAPQSSGTAPGAAHTWTYNKAKSQGKVVYLCPDCKTHHIGTEEERNEAKAVDAARNNTTTARRKRD